MLDERYHENYFQKTINWLGVFVLKLISYLPFCILYVISDIIYVLITYVVKYRKKVIVVNLKKSFPEKSDDEIKTMTKKYYRHLCDISIETIKAYSMSSKQYDKRITFKDYDILNDYFDQGKSIVMLSMHYNNWEWSCAFQRKSKHQHKVVYNPIRGNKAFENFMITFRTKWGLELIPVHKSGRAIIGFHRGKKPAILWLLSDQSPHPTSKFWTTFLNQETAYFDGAERVAHVTNQPVFMMDTIKVKRGHYEVCFNKLFDVPKETKEHEIMYAYSSKLEEMIRKAPEYYLWSHRRWKHKRPENISLYPEK